MRAGASLRQLVDLYAPYRTQDEPSLICALCDKTFKVRGTVFSVRDREDRILWYRCCCGFGWNA